MRGHRQKRLQASLSHEEQGKCTPSALGWHRRVRGVLGERALPAAGGNVAREEGARTVCAQSNNLIAQMPGHRELMAPREFCTSSVPGSPQPFDREPP